MCVCASVCVHDGWQAAAAAAGLTVGVQHFPGLSLQTLSQELLLLGQVLLDEAVLAHLLADLKPRRQDIAMSGSAC